jgi:hypothetical protein
MTAAPKRHREHLSGRFRRSSLVTAKALYYSGSLGGILKNGLARTLVKSARQEPLS